MNKTELGINNEKDYFCHHPTDLCLYFSVCQSVCLSHSLSIYLSLYLSLSCIFVMNQESMCHFCQLYSKISCLILETNCLSNSFLDIDDCIEQPCKNNGTCIDGVNNYTCNCNDMYTGRNCSTGKSGVF